MLASHHCGAAFVDGDQHFICFTPQLAYFLLAEKGELLSHSRRSLRPLVPLPAGGGKMERNCCTGFNKRDSYGKEETSSGLCSRGQHPALSPDRLG